MTITPKSGAAKISLPNFTRHRRCSTAVTYRVKDISLSTNHAVFMFGPNFVHNAACDKQTDQKVSSRVGKSFRSVVQTKRYKLYLSFCYVLLTVHLSVILANDQIDAPIFCFIISLLQSSTCFDHCSAHNQQVKLY
jgi:hypothetical protein